MADTFTDIFGFAPEEIAAVFKFESQIQAAIKALLATAGVTAYTQQDGDTKATPYVDIQIATGEEVEDPFLSNGKTYPQWFLGKLRCQVNTKRNDNTQDHYEYLGLVRGVCAGWQSLINNDNLPNLQIVRFNATGTSPAFVSTQDHDVSELGYDLKWKIKPTAWPFTT